MKTERLASLLRVFSGELFRCELQLCQHWVSCTIQRKTGMMNVNGTVEPIENIVKYEDWRLPASQGMSHERVRALVEYLANGGMVVMPSGEHACWTFDGMNWIVDSGRIMPFFMIFRYHDWDELLPQYQHP